MGPATLVCDVLDDMPAWNGCSLINRSQRIEESPQPIPLWRRVTSLIPCSDLLSVHTIVENYCWLDLHSPERSASCLCEHNGFWSITPNMCPQVKGLTSRFTFEPSRSPSFAEVTRTFSNK